VTGRTLALKLVSVHATAPMARFRREADHLARVQHPSVVALHDAGIDGEQAYLAMERIEGRTLHEVLDEGPMAPGRSVRLVCELLKGLGAVHDAGVVHRDIKPGNLLLVDEGTPGERLVLVDFGLSWSVGVSRVTATGRLVGTPQYLAPEMADGGDAVPRPALDVYQTALVLAEMVSGLPVVSEGTPHDCVRRHRLGVVLPGTLPPQLAAVIDGALRRDPEARFASARELRRALEATLQAPALAGAPPEVPERRLFGWALAGASAGLLGMAGALVVGGLLLVGVVWATWSTPSTPVAATTEPLPAPEAPLDPTEEAPEQPEADLDAASPAPAPPSPPVAPPATPPPAPVAEGPEPEPAVEDVAPDPLPVFY
jgi:serine/threonine-protein kinase